MDEVVKQGWLQKKGGGKRRANWTKRYFVLRGSKIDYYEDNKFLNLKGTIPIDGTLTTFNVVPFSEKKHAFVICLPSRDFVIQASSDVEMNRLVGLGWVGWEWR
jgi:switch-associated protein 70